MANGLFNLKQVMQAVQQSAWVAQKTPSVEYLVVAGGGSGGGTYGGGGGAGGLLQGIDPVPNGQTLLVTVGAGGTGSGGNGSVGTASVFGTISAAGGGGGSTFAGTGATSGGSGGGGGQNTFYTTQGVAGQGNAGGPSSGGGNGYGGGGGGAGTIGLSFNGSYAGKGGAGVASAISGTVTAYAGGGGGGTLDPVSQAGLGGAGGGGNGGGNNLAATAGTSNTGGGGGGAYNNTSPTGGSGIVIVSYPDVYAAATATTGSPTVSTSGSGSLYPNGAGTLQSQTTAPSQSGDFTLECWMNYSTTSSYRLFAGTATGANYVGLYIGNFVVNSSTTGVERQIAISGGAPAINTWFHYCLMRSGSTLYGFINGVLQGSVAFTDVLFATGFLQVCGYTATYQFPGYVSNLRLTNTVVYSLAGFTVPTGPLANVTGTALLMNTVSGAPYLDASSNAYAFFTSSGTQPLWNQESPFVTGAGYKNRVYTWTTSGSITF
jgi:hypothetical protein